MVEESVEWEEVARRLGNFEVLLLGSVTEAFEAFSRNPREFKCEYVPKYYRQFDGGRWFSRFDIEHWISALQQLEEEKPGSILEIMLDYENDLERAKKLGDEASARDYSAAPAGALLEAFNDFSRVTQPLAARVYHYLMLNKFYPDLLTAEIAGIIPGVEKQNEVVKTLFALEKPSFVAKEKESLAGIAEAGLKHGFESHEVEGLVSEHVRAYAFLGMYFYRKEPFDAKAVLERARQLAEKDLAKEKREIQALKEVDGKTQAIIRELNLSQATQLKIATVKEIGFAANGFDESYTYLVFKHRSLFNAIASQLGVSYLQLIEMFPAEVRSLLERNAKASEEFKKELEERKKDNAIVFANGSVRLLVGKELDEYYAKEKKHVEELTHLTEFKGQPASPGKAVGRVRKILSLHQIADMRKGEILVATATMPAFVPAMEKAAAIVTNEGGLLSHAAIVSRELGIPCVVGTKIATRALNDGDLIEVDATNGFVRKVG